MSTRLIAKITIDSFPYTVTFEDLGVTAYSSAPAVFVQSTTYRELYVDDAEVTTTQCIIRAFPGGPDPPFDAYITVDPIGQQDASTTGGSGGFVLGDGPPYQGAIILTEPKQLRFLRKADEDYTIRISYIPDPPAITAADQTLFLQEEYHEGLYFNFVMKVALIMGNEQLAGVYRALYDDWLDRNKFLASQRHRKVMKLNFRWV